jgi:uncharacterized protein
MTPGVEVVDTNVLVYAHMRDSVHHADASSLVEHAKDARSELRLFPQMMAEFYATVTNPRRVTAVMSPAEALVVLDDLLSFPGFQLLGLPSDDVTRWIRLLKAHPVRGQDVYDYQIAAAMEAHGIRTIRNYNLDDFRDFPHINALKPPPHSPPR